MFEDIISQDETRNLTTSISEFLERLTSVAYKIKNLQPFITFDFCVNNNVWLKKADEVGLILFYFFFHLFFEGKKGLLDSLSSEEKSIEKQYCIQASAGIK